MRQGLIKFQIGKNGWNENLIGSLNDAFKYNKVVRVGVLKSAISERDNLKTIGEELVKKLKGRFNYRVIGFTIVIVKR